ncbi:hypothetical protein T01_2147 [Trichinella spiralis]|uniref:Uncharacterized protein n=1 Tax=Trichinella spiralis TaxID=6334 RepID=A0A0V1AZG9_TRISP|nr:hypothetical protein T01_2147 [Trichinella spiralis]
METFYDSFNIAMDIDETVTLSAFNFAKQLLAMFMGYPFLTAGIPDLLPKGYQLHETEKYIFFIYPNGQIQPISKKYIVDP